MNRALLVLQFGAASLLGAQAECMTSMRTLQQEFDFSAFPNFPFCRCDEDTQFNPNRASYNGENICTSTKPDFIGYDCLDWVIFVDSSVPVPPTPTQCSTADIGKIEWVAGPNAKACVRKAVVQPAFGAEIVKTPDFVIIPSTGNFVMKVTNLNYNSSEAPVTVSLRLEAGCTFEDVFPFAIVYSVFNSKKDCCPIGALLKAYGDFLGTVDFICLPVFTFESDIFSAMTCVRVIGTGSLETNSICLAASAFNFVPLFNWVGYENFTCNLYGASTTTCGCEERSITILIYQEPGIACPAVGLHKFELNLASAANVAMWRGSFKDAMIGSRKTSAIYFETTRPIVKFTNLAIPCTMQNQTLTFLVSGATLADVCMGEFCQYAAFTTSDNSGACPGSLIRTA
ncbi:hypothetical protein FOA52_008261 [Chlamydomonas sp. UWO 241]|nr:hypothetical protein FOA52_008261 [Chlamydomonas sp. UWO 241]